jgi:hypothetical protein
MSSSSPTSPYVRTGFGAGGADGGVVTHSTMIVEECVRLRKFVQPIADRTHFQHSYDHNHTFLPNPSSVHTNTLLPFCLVLGNHSSGKSSFINHVLGRKVQTAGENGCSVLSPSPTSISLLLITSISLLSHFFTSHFASRFSLTSRLSHCILTSQVQTAGVAPTDDSFTIIVPGNEDMDKNGPALVGDPDLGFEG